MSDSVLGAFTHYLGDHHGDDPEDSENCGAFGLLRGKERAIFLEFRFRDGNVFAIGYTWLEKVSYNPSEGITLKFTDQTIRIRGRNLNAECRRNVTLINGILRHKVPWIQEANHARSIVGWTDKLATIVDSIEL